jgi:hypothetical protein
MVDTGTGRLSFKWSFSSYIIGPWPSVWYPTFAYVKIWDSYGTIYFRSGLEETIDPSEELLLDYSGGKTWITFKIHACYIEASPTPAFLSPEITLTFYIGDITNPVCAMKTRTDGYFYVPNIARGLLKIEMLFNDPNLIGVHAGSF